MSDIDRHGIHRVMKKALARVTDGTDYVHVSFDLDAVDPTVAPGVGTPVKGGLDYREAHLIMELLHDSGVMTSLEMVEVNPILDQGNASAVFAVELVQSADRPESGRTSTGRSRATRRQARMSASGC
jgi:Arginase/agmatinase/formimionoglutamate hydrolase, arginase family